MLLAGLVFVPPTSQREAPLLTLITLRRLSTLLVGVDTMVLSVRVALGDFVEKKKKKKEEEVTTQLPKIDARQSFRKTTEKLKLLKLLK